MSSKQKQWKKFILLNKKHMAELRYLRKMQYLHDKEIMFARKRIERLQRDNNRLYDKYDRRHYYDPTCDEVKKNYIPKSFDAKLYEI